MSQQSSGSDSLPATPHLKATGSGESANETASFFLWTRTAAVEHSADETNGSGGVDASQTHAISQQRSQLPLKRTLEVSQADEPSNEEPRVRQKAPSPATQRHNWRVPRFTRTQVAREERLQTPESEAIDGRAEDDEDQILSQPARPSNTLTIGRNWRIPLHVRANEAIASQARLERSQQYLQGLPDIDSEIEWFNAASQEEDLPRLADTDNSDDEDDDNLSLDEMELQDYLRYRLPSGFAKLDERLGHEAQHAAQFDLASSGEHGGLASGGILEVCGTPGSGKTTLLMQLALQERLNALIQAASSFAGDHSFETARQVVLIDTEGGISPFRLATAAKSLIQDFIAKWPNVESGDIPSRQRLLEHTLSGIHICRCTRLWELLATFEMLMPSSALYPVNSVRQGEDGHHANIEGKQLPVNTSLVLIDSISHFFRAPVADDATSRRERQHAYMSARAFARRVHAYGVKLIASNQLSTVFLTLKGERARLGEASGSAYMQASMREWLDDHLIKNAWRLMMHRSDLVQDGRMAKLIGRPASLSIGYIADAVPCDDEEAYWSAGMPFRINESGIIVDA